MEKKETKFRLALNKIENIFKKIGSLIAYYYKQCDYGFKYFVNKYLLIIITVLITGLSVLVRYKFSLYPTNDVAGIIFSWMNNIKKVGFSNFYSIDADYSTFLLFIYALITRFPISGTVTVNGATFYASWMYGVKTIIFIFDFLMALGIGLLVKELTKDKLKGFIAYWVVVCLPVQIFNSAVWGNCDSMYTIFFVYILLFLLKRKDRLVWLMFGLAMGMKLQAVFIFPFLVFISLSRRLKFYKAFYAICGLFITFLPAWICGASFEKPFEFIFVEMGRWNGLTLGCGNIWHFIGIAGGCNDLINSGSTAFGLMLIGLFMAILFVRKIELTDENLVHIGIFLIGIVPFFLPHMHERYFYPIDVLVVVYAFMKKKKEYLIVLMQISSGIAYYHYLSGKYFIAPWGEDSVHICAIINLIVLGVLFFDALKLDCKKNYLEEAEELKKELSILEEEHRTLVNKLNTISPESGIEVENNEVKE